MAVRKTDSLGDKAEDILKDASKNIEELGREARHAADNAKLDMVKMLYDSAKNLRKQARDAGISGDVVERVDDVATGFEKAATYLKRHSYEDMGEDAVKTVRQYPLQILAVVLIIGVIIGMLMRGSGSKS
jgi:hypothetical protein